MRISDWSSDVCSSDLKCIDDSEQSSHLETRLNCILSYTTRVLYSNVCRGLFEKDKLLFASLVCFQIEKYAGKISAEDRKSGVSGKSVSVRVDLGGCRTIKKKKKKKN